MVRCIHAHRLGLVSPPREQIGAHGHSESSKHATACSFRGARNTDLTTFVTGPMLVSTDGTLVEILNGPDSTSGRAI